MALGSELVLLNLLIRLCCCRNNNFSYYNQKNSAFCATLMAFNKTNIGHCKSFYSGFCLQDEQPMTQRLLLNKQIILYGKQKQIFNSSRGMKCIKITIFLCQRLSKMTEL